MESLIRTNLPLPGRREGKVRDVYDLPGGGDAPASVLIVATDRLSAFDVVLPTPLPGKGKLLTGMALRWFAWISDRGLCRTHVISAGVEGIPGLSTEERHMLEGRVIIGRRCRVVPIECVARGYLDGSGWAEYQASRSVCGVRLPTGLRRGDRLPTPIFTPATKALAGAHDENISFDRACEIAGGAMMERLRSATMAIYAAAHEYALTRGVILADTKFEWGVPLDSTDASGPDETILIDEALTPDSSRYWEAGAWRPGGAQRSFDKQYVRDYLQGLVDAGRWDKCAPGPALPDEIVRETMDKYTEAYSALFPDA